MDARYLVPWMMMTDEDPSVKKLLLQLFIAVHIHWGRSGLGHWLPVLVAHHRELAQIKVCALNVTTNPHTRTHTHTHTPGGSWAAPFWSSAVACSSHDEANELSPCANLASESHPVHVRTTQQRAAALNAPW